MVKVSARGWTGHVEVLGGNGGLGAPKGPSRERSWVRSKLTEVLFIARPVKGLCRVVGRTGPALRYALRGALSGTHSDAAPVTRPADQRPLQSVRLHSHSLSWRM